MGLIGDRCICAGVVKLVKFKHGGVFVDELACVACTDNGLCMTQDDTLRRLEGVDVHGVIVFCCVISCDRQRLQLLRLDPRERLARLRVRIGRVRRDKLVR